MIEVRNVTVLTWQMWQQWHTSHCSKSSIFVQKFSCWGYNTFYLAWQLWFHEKNSLGKIGQKTRENVGVILTTLISREISLKVKSCQNGIFGHKFDFSNSEMTLSKTIWLKSEVHRKWPKWITQLMMSLTSSFNTLKSLTKNRTQIWRFITTIILIYLLRKCRRGKLTVSRPLDNNEFSYSITNKITIAQIYWITIK